MNIEPDKIMTTDLDQQVKHLRELLELIRDAVQSSTIPSSSNVHQSIAQLQASLSQYHHEIAHLNDELNSLRALAEINQVVNSSLDLNDVLRIVMDTIIRLTNAERGFLMLREANTLLSMRIARNWEQESVDSSEYAISQTIVNDVVNLGQPILTTNAQEDPRFGNHISIIVYHLRSIMCVPLKVKGVVTGVIYVDNRVRSGIFTVKERDLLVAFSHQAAIAIENARLFASVNQTLVEVTELKNLMDSIFTSITSGVITANFDDQILLCNKAAETILGHIISSIADCRLREIFPPISPALESFITQAHNKDDCIVRQEVKYDHPQRGPVTLGVSLSPLKDASQSTQGVTIVLDDLTSQRRLEGQRRLLERMVSPKVIHQLDPDKLQLGGKRTEITTLFADIRGFTNFSESHDPEQLVWVLNRYLAAAADAVFAQDGTIDKFLGDAIMAWFNAPIPQPDHILRSIKAAIGIRESVQRLQRDLPFSLHLSFGVGIHYGEAVLGLIGSERQAEYTAIGDSVNIAKRIQENASKGQILISEAVFKLIEHQIHVRRVNPIHAKGKGQPIKVFELLGLY